MLALLLELELVQLGAGVVFGVFSDLCDEVEEAESM
jgi:hypothetical protein